MLPLRHGRARAQGRRGRSLAALPATNLSSHSAGVHTPTSGVVWTRPRAEPRVREVRPDRWQWKGWESRVRDSSTRGNHESTRVDSMWRSRS
jgi:hypothetical protein